jgi:hypothetical protein
MDGINGVGTSYSSFVPSYRSAKRLYFKEAWMFRGVPPQLSDRTLNLRFAHFLCAAQEMSMFAN